MADPLSLAAVGSVVLAEGVKFLFNQAGEVLKRWRERQASAAGTTPDETSEPVTVETPPIFEGTLQPLAYHFDRVAPIAATMQQLWLDLATYAQGIDAVDAANADLVAKADALRRELEAVFGQRITFKGEPREPSGTPVVVGTAEVEQLAGDVAGLRARLIRSGEARGEFKATRAEAGSRGTGLEVDTVGG